VLLESRGPDQWEAIRGVCCYGSVDARKASRGFTVECETVDDVLSVRRQAGAVGFVMGARRNELIAEPLTAPLVRPYVLIAYDVS
jgi:hypothetical protein